MEKFDDIIPKKEEINVPISEVDECFQELLKWMKSEIAKRDLQVDFQEKIIQQLTNYNSSLEKFIQSELSRQESELRALKRG